MRKEIIFFIFLVFIIALYCHAAEESGNNKNGGSVTITGTIQRFSAGGGFYGIKGDDGKEYNPLGLTDGFRIEGLKVKLHRLTAVASLFTGFRSIGGAEP
ncbi:MAG: hypothetical protein A2Z72_03220 [Omnitrophica bacterium RBG_13_46_9]|nr:MAG: hypothetical protein A2Z72_03220 [Omnitrophica bacterium RBG_13_46_9]